MQVLTEVAKAAGFFIRCIYVITADPHINILREKVRKEAGGHDVPKEKIEIRYNRALKLIPELINLCDICHIYDNSDQPFRIFKKRKDEYFYWENDFWDEDQIEKITGIKFKI